MGCCSSNLANQVIVHPDSKIQQCSAKEDTDGSLSNVDIQLIEDNWKLVEVDLQGHGNILFRRLFEENPAVMTMFYFAKEHECCLEKVMQDPKLAEHALNVMKTVGVAVGHLNDLPGLIPVLKQLGALHAKFQLQEEHFKAVGAALLWTLEQGLGDKFNDAERKSWTRLFNIVAINMQQGAADVEKQESHETSEMADK